VQQSLFIQLRGYVHSFVTTGLTNPQRACDVPCHVHGTLTAQQGPFTSPRLKLSELVLNMLIVITNCEFSSVSLRRTDLSVNRQCCKDPTLLMILHIAPAADNRPCGPLWQMDKFSPVRCVNQRDLSIFTYPICIWQPCWSWYHQNFSNIFGIRKQMSPRVIVWCCLCDYMLK